MILASYVDKGRYNYHYALNSPYHLFGNIYVWIDRLEGETNNRLSYNRKIKDNKIMWENGDSYDFSDECMNYFDKIIKLIVFL